MIEFAVRRVVVACDAVSENRAGIDAAAQLAKSWHALLHAVFVQDEGLLHLAALPFARQTGVAGAETLDETTMLRQLEIDASRARAAVEAAARNYALAPSFAVVRGRPRLASLSTEDRDLLVILASSRPFAGRFKLTSRWLAPALEANLPVLLLRNHADWSKGIICAMRSAKPSAWQALRAAAALAAATDRPLVVRIVDDAIPADDIRKWLHDVAPELSDQLRIEKVRWGQSIESGERILLVVDATPDATDLADLKCLAERSPADILFVR